MSTDEFIAVLCILFILAFVCGFLSFKCFTSIPNNILKKYVVGIKVNFFKAAATVILGYVFAASCVFMLGSVLMLDPPVPIKLIILDIDGVLNHNKAPNRINVSHLYDPACVDRLNKLIEKHHAKIVVCSAWRIGQTTASMQEQLNSIGVKGEVIGLTPWYQGYHTRDDEITAWLQEYDLFSKVRSMVLLDDDSSERFASIQVKPSWNQFGMLDHHLELADNFLSNPLPENFDIGKVSVCKSEATSETSFGGHHIQSTQLSSSKESSPN